MGLLLILKKNKLTTAVKVLCVMCGKDFWIFFYGDDDTQIDRYIAKNLVADTYIAAIESQPLNLQVSQRADFLVSTGF